MVWTACSAALAAAQPSLKFYSEFTRVDPFGHIVPADRSPKGLEPREILSPALVRNTHGSYHVVVSVPAGEEFTLFVVQNPFGALGLNLYKEKYEKRGEVWIPDALRPVSTQYTGALPDPAAHIDNQTHMSFLLDIFVPPRANVRRYRVEAQLLVAGRYIIYPLEVRVTSPVAQDAAGVGLGGLPGIEAGADAAAVSVLEAQFCGGAARGAPAEAPQSPATVRSLLLRNAREDVAIAQAVGGGQGLEILPALFGLQRGRQAWCAKPAMPPRDRGAEWYLRVRDHLHRLGRAGTVPAAVEAAPELKVSRLR